MVTTGSPVVESPTLTLEEFADLERIGMTSVRQMARTNTLPVPVLRIGRQYRISRKAYERWRDGETVTSADDAA